MSACAKPRDVIAANLGQPDTQQADRILDDLQQAGYHLVELPDMDTDQYGPIWRTGVRDGYTTINADGHVASLGIYSPAAPDEAIAHAAALIAAANAMNLASTPDEHCRIHGGHYWKPQQPGERNECGRCGHLGQVYEPEEVTP